MNKPKDICGKIVNHLTAVKFSHINKYGHSCWEYRCICGKLLVRDSNAVNRGSPKSCGCKKLNLSKDQTRKSLFRTYQNMITRCTRPVHSGFKNYGGRGIFICKSWNRFEVFKKWAIKNGFQIGLTIDRINVNKGYSPFNCRWVTRSYQAMNKRNSIYILYNGVNKSIGEWSKITGLHTSLIYSRKRAGMDNSTIFNKQKYAHTNKNLVN